MLLTPCRVSDQFYLFNWGNSGKPHRLLYSRRELRLRDGPRDPGMEDTEVDVHNFSVKTLGLNRKAELMSVNPLKSTANGELHQRLGWL